MVRLVASSLFQPSSNVITEHFKVLLFCGSLFAIFVSRFVFVILSSRFLTALWSPACKGLTSRVSCVVFLCFCHFPICGPVSESK